MYTTLTFAFGPVRYGVARGLMGGNGDANEPRCARLLLKDYVDGKLLYCHPPQAEGDDSVGVYEGAALKPATAIAAGGAKPNLVAIGPAHQRRYVDAVDASFFTGAGVRALVRDRSAPSKTGAEMATAGGKQSKRHFKSGRKEKMRRRGAPAEGTAGFVALG